MVQKNLTGGSVLKSLVVAQNASGSHLVWEPVSHYACSTSLFWSQYSQEPHAVVLYMMDFGESNNSYSLDSTLSVTSFPINSTIHGEGSAWCSASFSLSFRVTSYWTWLTHGMTCLWMQWTAEMDRPTLNSFSFVTQLWIQLASLYGLFSNSFGSLEMNVILASQCFSSFSQHSSVSSFGLRLWWNFATLKSSETTPPSLYQVLQIPTLLGYAGLLWPQTRMRTATHFTRVESILYSK